jgi:hypothetical protein
MPTAVLKADAVLDANCCPKSSQKMLDTKIMCCSVQQPYNHQPQRLIHQRYTTTAPGPPFKQNTERKNWKELNRTQREKTEKSIQMFSKHLSYLHPTGFLLSDTRVSIQSWILLTTNFSILFLLVGSPCIATGTKKVKRSYKYLTSTSPSVMVPINYLCMLHMNSYKTKHQKAT